MCICVVVVTYLSRPLEYWMHIWLEVLLGPLVFILIFYISGIYSIVCLMYIKVRSVCNPPEWSLMSGPPFTNSKYHAYLCSFIKLGTVCVANGLTRSLLIFHVLAMLAIWPVVFYIFCISSSL